MKTPMHVDWRSLQQESGFSPILSSKRLQHVQQILITNEEKCRSNAIIAILGVDSRYNDGAKELANYLLFDFFEKHELHLQQDGVPEEETDDLLIAVKPSSVDVYCTQSMYRHVLPYIGHWCNLSVYCYIGDASCETYEEDVEEYKIRSFVSMLQGVKKACIPYYSYKSLKKTASLPEFDVLIIEKWPIIQAYAAEGIGRGMFFTMEFDVEDISRKLHSLYLTYDPSAVQKVVCGSLPLLERHWFEAMNVVNGNSHNGSHRVASPSVTENDVAESIKSFFKHGRLSSANCGDRKNDKLPYVRFGASPDKCNAPPLSEGNGKSLSNAQHMILHSVSPKSAVTCTRTYFIRQPSTTSQHDYLTLIGMYQLCVESCQLLIEEYCSHHRKDVALASAEQRLLNAKCYNGKLSHTITLEAIDCDGSILGLTSGKPSMYLKKASVTICDINGDEGNLGSVSYCDTFLDSTILISSEDANEAACSDNTHMVLTNTIPVCAEWQIDAIKKYDSAEVATCDHLYLCSASALCCVNESCQLRLYGDGAIGIFPFNSPAFHLKPNQIKEMCFFNPTVKQDACHVLQIEVCDQDSLPPLFRKSGELVIGIAFYPNTTGLQTFIHKVKPVLSTASNYSTIGNIDDSLISAYNRIQSKYEWVTRSTSTANRLASTTTSLQPLYTEFMNHLTGNYAFAGRSITKKDFSLLLSNETKAAVPNTEHAAGKEVCVTVIAGLPGSHVERMCASLVAVNRERVRWVIVKCKCVDDNSFQLDREHLQRVLADVVSKRRSSRPGAAATKRLRIIVECVGFFKLSDVVSCIIQHNHENTRSSMVLGCVTACIEPSSSVFEHKLLFPSTLDHCAHEYVSCIAFTGKKHDVKDKCLLDMQSLTRMTNPHAAFLLAERGHMSRPGDFELILSDASFSDFNLAKIRLLKQSDIRNPTCHTSIQMREVSVAFSQPLIKGSFRARLRAIHNTLKGFPYQGNVYFIQGVVAFTDKPDQMFDVTYASTTSDINMEPKEQQVINAPVPPSSSVPAPPPSGKSIQPSKPYYLRFFGIDITEHALKDWLRKSGKQKPMKKNYRTIATLSTTEKKRIQKLHETDELPEGVFFNGTQYCSLIDNTKTYHHPCLDKFIEAYLKTENEKVDAYNAKLKEQSADMFT